jgi:hypothetical protein
MVQARDTLAGGVQIKGSAVVDMIRSVKTRVGEEGFRVLVALVDDPFRALFLGGIFDAAWYPLDAYVAFLAASLKYSGDDEKVLIDRTEAVIEGQLQGIYRVFVRGRSPESIIKRIVTIHRTYFNGASVVFELPTPGSAIVKYGNFEKRHRLLEYVIIGFYNKALKLCGAKSVEVLVTVPIARGGGFCELTVSWR